MNTFALLETPFFRSIETGRSEGIKNHYEEIRSLIVLFSTGDSGWRTIHTGLSLLIAETEYLLSTGMSEELAGYARRIIGIAVRLIGQVELMVNNTSDSAMKSPSTDDNNEDMITDSDPPVTLTANYSDVVEIINAIITMKMINNGRVKNAVIINGIHRLFGLDYSSDKYYNSRNAIRNRCPKEGTSLTYFLDTARDMVNAELMAG